MEKQSIIIRTTQNIDGEIEKEEIEVFGKWYDKKTKKYLLYKEDSFTDVTIKIEKDRLLIKKTGKIILELTLEVNTKRLGKLETPYGNFILETETSKIIVGKDNLTVEYKLFDENKNIILDNILEIITK